MCHIHTIKFSELIQVADLVIWDKALMMHKNAFETVDRMFKDLLKFKIPRSSCRLFGRKMMMLGSDFRDNITNCEKRTKNVLYLHLYKDLNFGENVKS